MFRNHNYLKSFELKLSKRKKAHRFLHILNLFLPDNAGYYIEESWVLLEHQSFFLSLTQRFKSKFLLRYSQILDIKYSSMMEKLEFPYVIGLNFMFYEWLIIFGVLYITKPLAENQAQNWWCHYSLQFCSFFLQSINIFYCDLVSFISYQAFQVASPLL